MSAAQQCMLGYLVINNKVAKWSVLDSEGKRLQKRSTLSKKEKPMLGKNKLASWKDNSLH